ncbi:hypothetical protein PQX77_018454 [Marasmius sp. AFHP31]|nr:hypothetical protein PQX77_018454 [Marasmius sp. AFHP31]
MGIPSAIITIVEIAEEVMRIGSVVAAPGKWLVDSILILRFLPDWFPGEAGFKRQARARSEHMYLQSLEPHLWVKEQMAKGTAEPSESFTSNLLQTDKDLNDAVLWAGGALYAAGAYTVEYNLKIYVVDAIQEKAHAELDMFMRRNVAFPPRKTGRRGHYHILAASSSKFRVGTRWGMMHDESVYPNPDTFDPDRFTGLNGRKVENDPRQVVFGFGRRICPGQYVAEASIWIQMALILACLRIEKGVGN